MALDFKNDATILWLLRNSEFVYRTISAQAAKDTTGDGLATERTVADVQREAAQLATLLEQNADSIEEIGTMTHEIQRILTAHSAEGSETLEQQINTTIEWNAENAIESSEKITKIESDLANYTEIVNGEIRRGFIGDPADPTRIVYGIAISSSLSFTGVEWVADDQSTYYQLAPEQTLGLYTSTGWQYWIKGTKVGWFDSQDKQLHVPEQYVENEMRLRNWLIVGPDSGFGIKYIGG